MSPFESEARKLLESHGCTFVEMIGEVDVVWKTPIGIVHRDDIFVLRHMTEKAWDFWKNNM